MMMVGDNKITGVQVKEETIIHQDGDQGGD
jgi:hypothetical protein